VIAQQAQMKPRSCISGWRHEADKLYWQAALEMKLMSSQPLWRKTPPKSSSRPATSSHLKPPQTAWVIKPVKLADRQLAGRPAC
jgi:hypothetical protein